MKDNDLEIAVLHNTTEEKAMYVASLYDCDMEELKERINKRFIKNNTKTMLNEKLKRRDI